MQLQLQRERSIVATAALKLFMSKICSFLMTMLFALAVCLSTFVHVCTAAPYDLAFTKIGTNPGNSQSGFYALGMTTNGDAVAGGFTSGYLESTTVTQNFYQFLVQRYDENGSIIWTAEAGGSSHELLSAVATDSSDNTYATGITYSPYGGVPAAALDIAYAKFSPTGVVLFYKQFGGTGDDSPWGMVADAANGFFYIVGDTRSPSLSGVSRVGTQDAFITKCSASTGAITSHRQFGASGQSVSFVAAAIDSTGAMWVVGTTGGAYAGQSAGGNDDILVQKFDSAGASVFVVLTGGSQVDGGTSLAIDSANNAYSAGGSTSSAVDGQASPGAGENILITKINSAGVKLWTKLLGGAGDERARCAAVDSTRGLLYVTGYTTSASFFGVANPNANTRNPFLVVVSTVDGSTVYSEVYPSTSNSEGWAVVTNGVNTYLAGVAYNNLLGQPAYASATYVLGLEGSTAAPTVAPTPIQTRPPTRTPSASPSASPSISPSTKPSLPPSAVPTAAPSSARPSPGPSAAPSALPTRAPSAVPTAAPSFPPTARPSAAPTRSPTAAPSALPTAAPSLLPTAAPSPLPTAAPSALPTARPSAAPTRSPTAAPSALPTAAPSALPTKVPTRVPTVRPTAWPTALPTASPTRVCLQWALSDYGKDCLETCAFLGRTCRSRYFTSINQESFGAIVDSAVSVRSGGAVGPSTSFCTEGFTSAVSAGVPAAFSVVGSAASSSPVRTACSYSAQASAACDAPNPLDVARYFCPCIDADCDASGEWYLGYSGESCDATCAHVGGVCDAAPLANIVDASSFSEMVASATALDTNQVIGQQASVFCNQGINSLAFASAPAAVKMSAGTTNQTLCNHPTALSQLQGDCGVAFQELPAQRFCNCKVSAGSRKLSTTAEATTVIPARRLLRGN